MDETSPLSVFWRDDRLPFIEARVVDDGRRVCYAKHSHETFSLGAITGGNSTYLNRDFSTTVGAGTLVLMNPADVHACNSIDDQPWSYRMLYVDTRWLASLQGGGGNAPSEYLPYTAVMSRDADVYDRFNLFFVQLVSDAVSSGDKQRLAEDFFRDFDERMQSAFAGVKVESSRLFKAATLIAENFKEPLPLAELCQVADLSRSHFIREFKAHFGLTPHAYLVNRRIQFARAQLKVGRAIADVAVDAGFADQAHLQRAFKKHLAATPGHYRGHTEASARQQVHRTGGQ
jgi:AraC-like DNA-binding protein